MRCQMHFRRINLIHFMNRNQKYSLGFGLIGLIIAFSVVPHRVTFIGKLYGSELASTSEAGEGNSSVVVIQGVRYHFFLSDWSSQTENDWKREWNGRSQAEIRAGLNDAETAVVLDTISSDPNPVWYIYLGTMFIVLIMTGGLFFVLSDQRP